MQYRSILEEHKAVRRAAGLFDVSHMGEVDWRAQGRRRSLTASSRTTSAGCTRAGCCIRRCAHPDGGVIDDLLVYMRGVGDYFPASTRATSPPTWIGSARGRRAGRDGDGPLRLNRALAVQGPKALGLVQPLTQTHTREPQVLPLHRGRGRRHPLHHRRTGYTGEDGFELYHGAGEAVRAGRGAPRRGNTARPRALRTRGARQPQARGGLPLYGHEITRDIPRSRPAWLDGQV